MRALGKFLALVSIVILSGCAHPASSPSHTPDAIDALVSDFSRNGGLWQNGIDTQRSARSLNDLMDEVLAKGPNKVVGVTTYRVVTSRKVRLAPDGQPPYLAVLLDTNLGQLILLTYPNRFSGCRVYDAAGHRRVS